MGAIVGISGFLTPLVAGREAQSFSVRQNWLTWTWKLKNEDPLGFPALPSS